MDHELYHPFYYLDSSMSLIGYAQMGIDPMNSDYAGEYANSCFIDALRQTVLEGGKWDQQVFNIVHIEMA